MHSPAFDHFATTTANFRFAQFPAADVEAITGLSTSMQRDWRRRGFLPKSAKHPRHNVFGLAALYVMKLLAEHGRGPAGADVYAQALAPVIVKMALAWSERAWATAPQQILDIIGDSACGDISDDERHARAVDLLFRELDVGAVATPPHAIWWPTGTLELGNYSELSSTRAAQGTESEEADARFDGPALVLPLDTIAANLVRRAGRPFVELHSAAATNAA